VPTARPRIYERQSRFSRSARCLGEFTFGTAFGEFAGMWQTRSLRQSAASVLGSRGPISLAGFRRPPAPYGHFMARKISGVGHRRKQDSAPEEAERPLWTPLPAALRCAGSIHLV
jgi:hypothetical protein